MEQGISPSQKFDDSPVSYGEWHPNNYEKDFWGPTTLHDALRESRNLVTIRLAAQIGMKPVAGLAQSLGLVHSMPLVLPAALGAVETTVMKEAGAYATIANGGRLVTPTLIDDIKDRNGNVVWRPEGVTLQPGSTPQEGPQVADTRPQVVSATSAAQIVAMMQDVVRRGTGVRAGAGIDRPIAGKTGTSQDFNDAWFAGFSPDLVTVVWIGFDTPQSLGKNETGGVIAGPIWNQVMKAALATRPRLDFRVPDGVQLARYDTGMGSQSMRSSPARCPVRAWIWAQARAWR